MDFLVLEGVPPYDGRYPLARPDEWTTREWGWIKRLAGYLPINLDEEQFTDPEFLCVWAAITLRRAGKIEAAEVPAVFGQLSDAPPEAAFQVISEDEQETAEELPPTPSSSENGDISGEPSPSNSETLVMPPRATGTADLDISASARRTSVS